MDAHLIQPKGHALSRGFTDQSSGHYFSQLARGRVKTGGPKAEDNTSDG